MSLSQPVSFLYNVQLAGLSADRSNLKGPLVIRSIQSWTLSDKLNKLISVKFTVVKRDVELDEIYFERKVFVKAFDFDGIITGLLDIDDDTLEITVHELAWHFTRRLYRIVDAFKEYNISLVAPASLPDLLQGVLDSANTDMPFDWKLGDDVGLTISNLNNLWKLDGTLIDDKNGNDGTIHNGPAVYVDSKYGKGIICTGDTHVDVGGVISLNSDYSLTSWFRYPLVGDGLVNHCLFINTTDDAPISVRKSDNMLGVWEDGVGFTSSGFDMSTLKNGLHFIGAVADDTLSEIDFYIDGIFVGNVAVKPGNNLSALGNAHTVNESWGEFDDVRLYLKKLTGNEMQTLYNAKFSYLDTIRIDEIPSTSSFDFDIKWKHYYHVLRKMAIESLNDLWFEHDKVFVGRKGKNIILDRDDKIYQKLQSKIDLDTYGNIVNVVGAKSGGTNLYKTVSAGETDLQFNYERVVSNNNLKTQTSLDKVADRVLPEFNTIEPDVRINIQQDIVDKYDMESGDVILIRSNSHTQTTKGFYRIIEIVRNNKQSSIKLQFSATGKFLPRISDTLDMLEAAFVKLHDLELNG